jgi:hypothetical protein
MSKIILEINSITLCSKSKEWICSGIIDGIDFSIGYHRDFIMFGFSKQDKYNEITLTKILLKGLTYHPETKELMADYNKKYPNKVVI